MANGLMRREEGVDVGLASVLQAIKASSRDDSPHCSASLGFPCAAPLSIPMVLAGRS